MAVLTFTKPSNPQINYSHMANRNIQFSYIATPGFHAYDLVKHAFGTKTGAPTKTNDKIIGEALKFGAGTTDVYSFTSRATKSSPATIAFIGVLNSTAGSSRTYFQNSSAAGGILLDNQSSGSIQLVARGGIAMNPTIAVSTATPYFAAFSMAPNFTVHGLVLNLATGAVTTSTATNASGPSAGNATYLLGNLDLAAQSANADLAAVLFSNTFITLDGLKAWAKDPWGPWRLEQPNPSVLMGASTSNNNLHSTITMDAFAQTASALNPSIGNEHWSTTFNTGSFSLSNANLTATATAHNAIDTIISVQSHSSSKYYFEITAGSGADLEWGITSANNPNNSVLWVKGVAMRSTGNWRISSTETASGIGSIASVTLGFAVDLDNKLIWIRKTGTPGTWYGDNAGTPDPATGTHGFSFSTAVDAGQPMFIAFTSNQNGVDEAATMDAGAVSFDAAPPTGYTSWAQPLVDAAIFSSPHHNRTSARKTYKIR